MTIKNKLIRTPLEFDRWIKKIQKQLFSETNEIFSKVQIMKMLSRSKVNFKKKGEGKNEIGFGF